MPLSAVSRQLVCPAGGDGDGGNGGGGEGDGGGGEGEGGGGEGGGGEGGGDGGLQVMNWLLQWRSASLMQSSGS